MEKLGYGLFMSGDAKPLSKSGAFSFDGWELENYPTTPVRISFNWHNFLFSCSTWDLEDWEEWIAQSQKSGFNTVMVHAYGNNPMFSYAFNGQEKPVGELASTRSGRDWAVNHVNDVRLMQGSELFDQDFFGSEAVVDESGSQSETVKAMMGKAFEYADQRGVDVNIAIDIDMPPCLPQNLITTLNEADRFLIDYAGRPRMKVPAARLWVARPDTAEGYTFYKAQCDALLKAYPQVDMITLWRRGDKSPLLNVKLEEYPAKWQAEYKAYVTEHPKVAKQFQSVGLFGIAKMYAAWKRALKEAGREDITLAMGSWNDKWIPVAVEFLPHDTPLIALDSRILRGTGFMNSYERLKGLGDLIGPERFIPVIWSHHDDGAYIGSPLDFVQDLSARLQTCMAGGFGIIHWMTHPLDPYYTAHSRQTWSATKNESQSESCAFVARNWFGAANETVMGEYLDKWVDGMPAFARETDEYFIGHEIGHDLSKVKSGYEERLALLQKANVSAMSESQRKQYAFFKEYELFVLEVYQTLAGYEQATNALAQAQFDQAREIVRGLNPEKVVADYASAVKKCGATKGEMGLLVSMNTRWIPHFVRLRQQLGLDAIRYNFGPTDHELMAQARGQLTFHYEADKAVWQTFGAEETGAEVFETSTDGVFQYGVMSDQPMTLMVSPILSFGCSPATTVFDEFKPEPVSAGNYKLSLLFNTPVDSDMQLDVRVGGKLVVSEHVSVQPEEPLKWDAPVTLSDSEIVSVILNPVKGHAVVCGLVLK
ncbi:hypothetical protein [Pontiella agarivorans]|uniref:Glycoside hydrolase family 42 N-terminal domain-containing protein n=1 Tax=Pontiella agarivorans TaxID=3038953 RepID=A0ABU5N1C3_9BACT|nr:hypothetical protein [Pontiella agarivorans]MDZ8120246.1 hypothetical protein [Pontiella agarivorans]